MMRGHDPIQPLPDTPLLDQPIAHGARPGLHIAGDGSVGRKRRMHNALPRAPARHHGRLVRRLRAQPMIDGHRRHAAGKGACRQIQQRHAVRPARHGNAESRRMTITHQRLGRDDQSRLQRRVVACQLHFA